MNKVVIAVIISLLAGLSLAAWYQSSDPQPGVANVGGFDASAGVMERLQALETA